MFENITNLALGYNFNKYTDLYSGYTKEWTKPTEEDIRRIICKYYLINYAGWSEPEAENGAKGFAEHPELWSLSRMVEDMKKVKEYRENWDSGTTSVAAWWRNDNWTPLFFPKLDMANVQNAERCWHSNYNCWFYPSVDIPLATNVAGMYYYQDCQWICGDINLPSLTTAGSNRFIWYLTRLRCKITLNLPNLTSLTNGLLQSTALDYVPTVNVPKLEKCGYMMFRGANFLKDNDVIRELGPNMNWSGCTDFRWMCYQTSGTSKFDLSLIDFSSAVQLTSMFYKCSTGLTVEMPTTWNLPNATSINYTFCGANVEKIGNINSPNAVDYEAAFATPYLEEIGTVYCGKVTDFQYIFDDCTALTTIGGLTDLGMTFTTATTQENSTLDLSFSPLLSHQSVLNVINSVYTLGEGVNGYIKLHSDVYAQLTEEEIQMATNKGWTIG